MFSSSQNKYTKVSAHTYKIILLFYKYHQQIMYKMYTTSLALYFNILGMRTLLVYRMLKKLGNLPRAIRYPFEHPVNVFLYKSCVIVANND